MAKVMKESDDHPIEEDDEFPSLEDMIECAEGGEGEDTIEI